MAGCEGLGELTCNRCGNRVKHDKLLHTNPNCACGYSVFRNVKCRHQQLIASKLAETVHTTILVYAPHVQRVHTASDMSSRPTPLQRYLKTR